MAGAAVPSGSRPPEPSRPPGPTWEDWVEAVLDVVATIPAGRVSTYGRVASALGRGGPRTVARVLATRGEAVPWWRVVRADGHLPAPVARQAAALLGAEGVTVDPVTGRLDLATVGWAPDGSRRPPADPSATTADGRSGGPPDETCRTLVV